MTYEELIGGKDAIAARRLSGGGVLGSEIAISSQPSDNELNPVIAVNRTSGAFVVAFEDASTYSSHLTVTEVSSANAIFGTTVVGPFLTDPALSIDGNGYYMLTYTSSDVGHSGIHGRFGLLN
jgi:hypothetical protein